MVNRVSPVRKLFFLWFCHVGFVTSQNSHTWRSGGFNKYARLDWWDYVGRDPLVSHADTLLLEG